MTLLILSTTHTLPTLLIPSSPLMRYRTSLFHSSHFILFPANENYFSVSGNEVEKDVRVGMTVLILAEEILDRSFRRFQWWEKPPPDVIAFMANKKGTPFSYFRFFPKLARDCRSGFIFSLALFLPFTPYLYPTTSSDLTLCWQ